MSSSILNKLRGTTAAPAVATKVDPAYVEKLASALEYAADNYDLVPEPRQVTQYVQSTPHKVDGQLLGRLLREKVAEKQQATVAQTSKVNETIISNILSRVRATGEAPQAAELDSYVDINNSTDDEPSYVPVEEDPIELAAGRNTQEPDNTPNDVALPASATLADLMASVSTGGAKGTSDSAAADSQATSTKTASARGQGPLLARTDGDVLRRLRERTASVK